LYPLFAVRSDTNFEFALHSDILTEIYAQFSEDGEQKKNFYHTPRTRELDNLLGDIYHKILGMLSKLAAITS
jgi:hypothetical protein